MYETYVAITIVNIEHHYDSTCISIKFCTDHFVIIVARKVKEVNANLIVQDIKLLYAIIDSNSRDVALDEAAFAVSLDQATLARFLVADADYLEEEIGWLRDSIERWIKIERVPG